MAKKVTLVEPFKPRVDLYDPRVHGVNATLLSKWVSCRQRALLDLNGWTPTTGTPGQVFGIIAHEVLRDIYEKIRARKVKSPDDISKKSFRAIADGVVKKWREQNPRLSPQMEEELELIQMQIDVVLPLYFQCHKKDFDPKVLAWNAPEEKFEVPYAVPTQRYGVVRTFLRGRIDGSLVYPGSKRSLALFETKTKSRFDPATITDMLTNDRQVMIYFTAMRHDGRVPTDLLYNVIRRPGQRLTQKDGDLLGLAKRLEKEVRGDMPHYFQRFRMRVTKADLDAMEAQVAEHLRDFVLWWAGDVCHYKNSDHCENKYGRCEFLGKLCGNGDVEKGATLNKNSYFYKRNNVFRMEDDV